MSLRQKKAMIEELTEKLASLNKQKDTLDDEANILAEKRDRLNEQQRNLRAEIQELRVERDRTNEQVRELKLQRNDATAKIREKIEEIKKLGEERHEFLKKKPSRSHRALEEEIESIDWKIQTSSLTLREEKDLGKKVEALGTQLGIHKKIEQLNTKIDMLHKEVTHLRAEHEHCHEALTAYSQKSQEIHAKMLAKIEELKKTKTESDIAHKRFLEERTKTQPLRREIEAVSCKIRQLEAELREQDEKERKQSENMLRQTLENKAKEKLKRGEKLNWEEFQLLAEKEFTSKD